MRNLRNIRHTQLQCPEAARPFTASAWDADTDGLLCTIGPTETSAVIELRRLDKDASAFDQSNLIASWDAPCPKPDLKCDKILSLKYFAENQTTCLILAGGDLVVVREAPQKGEDLIEIVGSVDAGITAASWSPDEELVAITTGAGTFLLMTRLFESTANIQMTPEDVKVSAHVSVGWGKSETQFKGKRAKALRDPTVPEHVDEGKLSPYDDGATSISWRGDGAFVAVNTIDEVDQRRRRMIRVFSREGVLDSVSEPVDGLESALSWRPAGNLIAAVQNHSNKVDVIFFERNGLRHGEFTLRLDSDVRPDWSENISLAWNSDSSVLAVSFKDKLQLWTMGNYHYYLKQQIAFSPQEEAVQVNWHAEKPLVLTAHTAADLRSLSYYFTIASGSAQSPGDLGVVMVIDGTILRVTPLRLANVPPPMQHFTISCPSPITDVCINAASDRIAVLHQNSIAIYSVDMAAEGWPYYTLAHSSSHSVGGATYVMRQILSDSAGGSYLLTNVSDEADDEITTVGPTEPDSPKTRGKLASIFMDTQRKKVYGQEYGPDASSTIYVLTPYVTLLDRPGFETTDLVKFPIVCPRMEAFEDDEVTIIFGLSAGGTLYAYSRSEGEEMFAQGLQVRGVTSFLVTTSHLIFTTSQHLVKFVHLHGGELKVPLDEPEKDERCRSVERGARLVTVMPSTYALVLQMPRGNLETIYPRALVLAGIRKAILAKDYRKAFFACRNHRVDMNIIHDYAPIQFMSCISLFVDQVNKPAHIDLFLSQLREEDVTETLYKETLNAPKLGQHALSSTNGSPEESDAPANVIAISKVNRICDGFLNALDTRRSTNLQNVVTSHVCKSPPDLEAGLQLVADLRKEDPAHVDQAIEHICFLADVNRLYDTALGLYNLDVAILVAQQSQKDPREYLPYLQSLQDLPEQRQRFTIDNDLRRYSKALRTLHTMDEFEDFKAYTVKHDLYTDAIDLYKYQSPRLSELMRLQATHLLSRNRFHEAALTYDFLSDHSAASDAYFSAQLWQEALTSALLAGQSPSELTTLAESLASGLEESKDFLSAAQIYAEHLSSPSSAARCYCLAYRFASATRIIALSPTPSHLLTTVLDPALVDAFTSTSETLAEMKTQLTSQVPRLRLLREAKRADPLAFYDDVPSSGKDVPDDISVAPSEVTTSAGTFLTRYTKRSEGTLGSDASRRTSRNRRREERKKARGKKGSVYEEEYLVASVGRLVERWNAMGEEVRALVEGLFKRGMRERAVAVGGLMREVGGMCRGCLGEVFEVEKEEKVEGGEGQEEGERKKAPVVGDWEGLSLLG